MLDLSLHRSQNGEIASFVSNVPVFGDSAERIRARLLFGGREFNLAPGHSAHSMASEFFTEDFLAGASSGMRTSADASVHAHGPSLTTTHASVIDLVLSIEKVSVRSTLA